MHLQEQGVIRTAHVQAHVIDAGRGSHDVYELQHDVHSITQRRQRAGARPQHGYHGPQRLQGRQLVSRCACCGNVGVHGCQLHRYHVRNQHLACSVASDCSITCWFARILVICELYMDSRVCALLQAQGGPEPAGPSWTPPMAFVKDAAAVTTVSGVYLLPNVVFTAPRQQQLPHSLLDRVLAKEGKRRLAVPIAASHEQHGANNVCNVLCIVCIDFCLCSTSSRRPLRLAGRPNLRFDKMGGIRLLGSNKKPGGYTLWQHTVFRVMCNMLPDDPWDTKLSSLCDAGVL